MRHQVFEAGIRLHRRAEADILPHRPDTVPVHVLVDAAGERVFAGTADVAIDVDAGEILGPVDRLDRKSGVRSQLFHGCPPCRSRNRAMSARLSGPRSSGGAWPQSASSTTSARSKTEHQRGRYRPKAGSFIPQISSAGILAIR